MLALKAMTERVFGWGRVKVRQPVGTPGEYQITGYKDGQAQKHIWAPADPKDPKLPDGSDWR